MFELQVVLVKQLVTIIIAAVFFLVFSVAIWSTHLKETLNVGHLTLLCMSIT